MPDETDTVGEALKPVIEPTGDMAVDWAVWGSSFRAVEYGLGRELQ